MPASPLGPSRSARSVRPSVLPRDVDTAFLDPSACSQVGADTPPGAQTAAANLHPAEGRLVVWTGIAAPDTHGVEWPGAGVAEQGTQFLLQPGETIGGNGGAHGVSSS